MTDLIGGQVQMLMATISGSRIMGVVPIEWTGIPWDAAETCAPVPFRHSL